MAKDNSSYRDKARPYLTSEELVELTGASRRTLTTLTELGICKPKRFEKRGGVLGWTFDQAATVHYAERLRAQGLPFERIAQLVDDDAFELESFRTEMAARRSERRSLKRALIRNAAASDTAQIPPDEELYVRYIPQRWIALLPMRGSTLPQDAPYVPARLLLDDVSKHVGWCAAVQGGTIVPAFEDEMTQSAIFIELAAKPIPQPLAGHDADGGCYHAFGGACAFGNETPDCRLCPRFGSETSNGDKIRWLSMAQRLPVAEEPLGSHCTHVESGVWGDAGQDDGHAMPPKTKLAGRPQLMPLPVLLPAHIGAAVLPAGFYLCRAWSGDEQDKALIEMRTAVKIARARQLTADAAAQRVFDIEKAMSEGGISPHVSTSDECAGPLTGPTLIADRAWQGYLAPVEFAALPKLTVLEGASICESTGADIICMSIPSSGQESTMHYEFQVLLDTPPFAKKPKKGKRKGHGFKGMFGKFALGLRPVLANRLDSVATVETTCWECGCSFEAPENSEVATCPRCGGARILSQSSSPQVRALLDECELALVRRQWDEALRLAEFAAARERKGVEGKWFRLLARTHSHWEPDPTTGRRRIVMDEPPAKPIFEDSDMRSALNQADEAQWVTYSLLATQLEHARREALGLKLSDVRYHS